ncbi:hypothetical protein JTB14_031429 [Gonioctena quinquepunctata]|nr:hypothetical protein JTB14_031429 [Gonioctena quinquepunctata]
MTGRIFDELLGLISTFIVKQDTVMRNAIPAEERLSATLRYSATGRSYADLKFSTGMAARTLGYIIPKTYVAICRALEKYLKMLETEEEWKKIALGFKNRWQVINCGGAIDGKHIRIKPPAGSAALYYNYKNFYSVVLLAVVNHNYEFVFVVVRKQGRLSDGGIIDATLFSRRLKENT